MQKAAFAFGASADCPILVRETTLKPEPPYFDGRKPTRCPACGSARVVRIMYGEPGPEMIQADERGEAVLGGCCISDHDPSWQCIVCSAVVYRNELRGLLNDEPQAF